MSEVSTEPDARALHDVNVRGRSQPRLEVPRSELKRVLSSRVEENGVLVLFQYYSERSCYFLFQITSSSYSVKALTQLAILPRNKGKSIRVYINLSG